jgi:hypothetical protein
MFDIDLSGMKIYNKIKYSTPVSYKYSIFVASKTMVL